MKILVGEDDAVTRKLLSATLERLGWDVITAEDGDAAWRIFETAKGKDAPELAVLDWMMPGLEGIEICRRLRTTPGFERVYVILLTSRRDKEDLLFGLAAGANDYIAKPFDPVELAARVRVGERMVNLQRTLADRVTELEEALTHVKRLQSLLPICSYCKKVRNEANYWQQVDSYLASHLEVKFTHGICPECLEKMVKELDESPLLVPKPIEASRPLETLERLASGSLPDLNAGVATDRLIGFDTLDEAALMDLVSGDRELAGQLAELFLVDIALRVPEITAAVEGLDAERLCTASHSLRGSAGSLRAGIVSAAAGVLEKMGLSRDMDDAPAALEVLNAALASLRPRLVVLAGRA